MSVVNPMPIPEINVTMVFSPFPQNGLPVLRPQAPLLLCVRLIEQADDPSDDRAYAHETDYLGDCGDDEKHGGCLLSSGL